jgi:hypothetical protein
MASLHHQQALERRAVAVLSAHGEIVTFPVAVTSAGEEFL